MRTETGDRTAATRDPDATAPGGPAAPPARPGAPRRAGLAALTDRWLASLFDAADAASLVAVGGYGRGELPPRSDPDPRLLHDGTLDKQRLAALADRVWCPVWDLDLDRSVRTAAQARRIAVDACYVTDGRGAPLSAAALREALTRP